MASPAAARRLICLLLPALLSASSTRAGDDGMLATQRKLAMLGDVEATGALPYPANALRGVVANPLPWAIVLGAVFSIGGFKLPGALGEIVKMLADAATPVALFTIGRITFRRGYPRGAPGRAFGIVTTLLPTYGAFAWVIFDMLAGLLQSGI